MTRDSWDWSFASFAEEPALDDDDEQASAPRPPPWLDVDDDEPTASRSQPSAPRAVSAALEEHMVNLRKARTQAERQAAAEEALQFLNEARRQERRLASRPSRVDEGPTLVDEEPPVHMIHADMFSSSAPTPRP